MKILIAPDKFKGSMTAPEVCESIAKGIYRALPDAEIVSHPLADGGEGSIEILAKKWNLQRVNLDVQNPRNQLVSAHYYLSEKRAFIELAVASGLSLLAQDDRNPLKTTTFGTGQLIKDALDNGAQEIFLFVGGSATNDGGMGIAQALGCQFWDEQNQALLPIGENLSKVHQIDTSSLDRRSFSIAILHDVTNPLFGLAGAAYSYAEQKGASPSDIQQLDRGLRHLSKLIQVQFGLDISDTPGVGAAGGVGACLIGLVGAKMQVGIETIMSFTEFPKNLSDFDFIISGEGQLDGQSLEGKVVGRIAALAKESGTKLVLYVGHNKLSNQEIDQLQVESILEIIHSAPNLYEAMGNGPMILEQMAFEFFTKE